MANVGFDFFFSYLFLVATQESAARPCQVK